MVPGQHRAGEVVEATRTGLAPVALPVRLRVVAAVAHHGATAASRAAHALRPAMLPHQGEALGVIDQGREIDQIRCGHGGKRSFDGGELPSCSYHLSTCPARPAFLPISTPDPEKSHAKKPKTGADLAIAAIAIARGGIVVTGDVGDFLAIHPAFPLPGLYDPFADAWQVRPARGRR
jgi:hypothetical protein